MSSHINDAPALPTERSEPVPPKPEALAASNDNRASPGPLDQYYTRPDVAAQLYDVFQRYFDPERFHMVEPSAGDGSFFKLLPAGSAGYDVDPKWPGVVTADFLKIALPRHRPIAIIGNPPFGKNSSAAVRFFNHAASAATVIAFILPKTFRKKPLQNKLDPAFHLLHEEEVPTDAFLFQSEPYDVPTVFQIWVRRSEPRGKWRIETKHPDFEFTTAEAADFVIQRVGANAGRVHRDFGKSTSSHLFIRGPVEAIMRQLDFASVAGNVAGNPSVSKGEIIFLYRQWIERQAGR